MVNSVYCIQCSVVYSAACTARHEHQVPVLGTHRHRFAITGHCISNPTTNIQSNSSSYRNRESRTLFPSSVGTQCDEAVIDPRQGQGLHRRQQLYSNYIVHTHIHFYWKKITFHCVASYCHQLLIQQVFYILFISFHSHSFLQALLKLHICNEIAYIRCLR